MILGTYLTQLKKFPLTLASSLCRLLVLLLPLLLLILRVSEKTLGMHGLHRYAWAYIHENQEEKVFLAKGREKRNTQ